MTKKLMKKVCLLGDGAVGKTSLIKKFVFDKFDDKYIMTFGTKVTKKQVQIDKDGEDFALTLLIWDILGQKVHNNLHSTYYQGASAAFIVCDVSRKETIEHMEDWISVFRGVNKDAPIILLGNKSDLADDHDAIRAMAAPIAQKHNLNFYMTSAKTGDHVEESFIELGKSLVDIYAQSKGGV